MQLKGRDIVCVSTQYWDETWFRKQEFMSRFERANRVLFVEPSYSIARRSEPHLRRVADNRHLLPRLEDRGNLVLFKPPRALPKWSDPRVEKVTYRWYSKLIARAMKRLGFQNTILWVYRPAYYPAIDAIPHHHLVFDLVDDIAAYDGQQTAHSKHVEECITGLARRSDLLVVTAQTLLDRYGGLARHSEQIANGFDARLFSPKHVATQAPPELAGLKRPILGFIGTLFKFIDFTLLTEVARAHSDKSLVLVGPVEQHAEEWVKDLTRLPNVTHIPPKPKAAVPGYIRAFDVCLNPFRPSRVADSVNPLKVYEYLAMGRPVVSTPMESLRREPASQAVAFAEDTLSFCIEIDRCLSPAVQQAEDARREAVVPYSWDTLFGRLDAACDAALRE